MTDRYIVLKRTSVKPEVWDMAWKVPFLSVIEATSHIKEYGSRDAHYCVAKASDLVRVQRTSMLIPVVE